MRYFILLLIPSFALANAGSFVSKALNASLNYETKNISEHKAIIQPFFSESAANELFQQIPQQPNDLSVTYKALNEPKIIENTDGSINQFSGTQAIQLNRVSASISMYQFILVHFNGEKNENGYKIKHINLEKAREPIIINHLVDRYKNCPKESS